MVATGLAVLAVAMAGQLLLVAAVLRRLRSGPRLASVLRAHAVVPRWAQSPAAAAGIETAQVTAGLTGIGTVLFGRTGSTLFAASCVATAVTFTGFAGYLLTVLRRRGRVPCGCLGGRETVRAAAITRAVVFAVAPLAALPLARGLAGELAAWPVRLGLAGLAAFVAAFAVYLVSLADALADQVSGKDRGGFTGRARAPGRRRG